MLVTGNATATSGDQTIGTIELPQRAQGNWKIYKVYGQLTSNSQIAADAIGGYMKLSPNTGEITPHPAPSKIPLFGYGAYAGSQADATPAPLQSYDVDLEASGKANIDLIFNNATSGSTTMEMVLGILFGDEIPPPTRFKWVDNVRNTLTSTSETSIGTIELSANATKIVGIAGIVQPAGTPNQGQEVLATLRLDSDDIKIVPAQYPFHSGFHPGVGTSFGSSFQPKIEFLPVSIPVQGGARIDCFATLYSAVSNGADTEIFIAYV